MKIIKKLKLFVATSVLVVSMTQISYGRITLEYDQKQHIYTAQPINLIVNGKPITDLPLEPILIDGRTLVPAREVFEELGAVVDYKPMTREIFVGYDGDLLELKIDSNWFTYNDRLFEIDVAPRIINSKTMLPFRAVAEAMGLQVDWDDATRSVLVSDGNYIYDVPTVEEEPEPIVEEPVVEEPISEKPTDKEEIPTTTEPDKITDIPPKVISYGQAVDKSTTVITEMSAPLVDITSITLPGQNGSNEDSIIIKASGPISKVDKFLLEDNRLVLDVYNSNNSALASQTIAHPFFTAVRTGQNQVNPPVTRIVTDLTDNTEFYVELSRDRTELRVIFTQNSINNISFESDQYGEYIKIFGEVAPSIVSDISLDNSVLTLELPSSVFVNDFNYTVTSQFLTNIVANKNSNKVTLNLKERPGVSFRKEGIYTKVTLRDLSKDNFIYDEGTNTAIIKKAGTTITANSISLDEDFIVDKKLTVKIDGDYRDYLGADEVFNNGTAVERYKVNNSLNGNTEILFTLQTFGTFAVTEDSEYVFLTFKNPKEIYPKIIVLDTGHGGGDPGAIANGVKEKDVNLMISMKLKPLLEQAGYKVYTTRSTDRFVELVTIGNYATAMGDIMISIHANSASPNALPSGIETLWYEHANDNTIGISSKEAATIMQKSLINNLGAIDRGPKRSALIIFKNSNVPSILVETGFLSNVDEVKKLQDSAYQDKVANAILNGTNNIFAYYTPKR